MEKKIKVLIEKVVEENVDEKGKKYNVNEKDLLENELRDCEEMMEKISR